MAAACSTAHTAAVQFMGDGRVGGEEKRAASFVEVSDTRAAAFWNSGSGGRGADSSHAWQGPLLVKYCEWEWSTKTS